MSYELEMVLKVTQSNVHDTVRILTGAFWNDPLVEYLFPDDGKRLEQLGTFFRVNLKFSMAAGEVYGTSSMLGCAVWLFPGDKSKPRLSRVELPSERFRSLLDEESLRRYVDFEHFMSDRHINLMCPSFCLLLFLGVEENQRRRGIGSRLIQPVLKFADEAKLPCILDTMNEDNLPFYRKHGFTVCQEYRICEKGPHTWTMIRPPS
jgi:ribosomal protein S18 acetylase RimI-like enzyme